MLVNAVVPPFCRADFFDRFEAGKTVLYLEFVHREKGKDAVTQTERTDLLSVEVLGVYAGREGDAIKVDPGFGPPHKIHAADIRSLKEISPGEISAGIQCVLDAAALLAEDPDGTVAASAP